jgi:hypothetical protein
MVAGAGEDDLARVRRVPRQVALGDEAAVALAQPSAQRFSTKFGCARRIGVALRMVLLPGMLLASISSAMATRMMYGLSTDAGPSGLPPKMMTRCGSHITAWAPNLDSSLVQPIAPS